MDTGPGSGPGFHNIAAEGSTAVHSHRLFFLRDSNSGRRFVVNAGSSFSILLYRSTASVFWPGLPGANNKIFHEI
jgi:hypothetical protein